jgi:cytochrome b pre-mRNA-processing protein 3
MFLFPLTPKGWTRRRKAVHLYRRILARSRAPVFYRDYGVADTFDGRFDVLCLHAALVVDRLLRFDAQPEGGKLAQALFDEMFLNLEFTAREMGVGDLAVPHRIKKWMEGFNGRAQSYRAALRCEGEDELKAVMLRNLYAIACAPDDPVLNAFALYVRNAESALARMSLADLIKNETPFPHMDEEEKNDAQESRTEAA